MSVPGGAVTGLLALLGAGLVVVAARTARPPGEPLPSLDGYFDRWAPLHGGYDPRTGSRIARGWLVGAYRAARPLARAGVQPDVVTLSSAWLAGVVVALCWVGGHWLLAAGALLTLGGLLDNLDGCVALLTGRTSRWGYVLDSVVDRVVDSVWLGGLVLLGVPAALAAGTGAAVFLLEYARARAGNAGGDAVGRITVAERPTRVIVLAFVLVLGGVVPSLATELGVLGASVLLALTLVGLAQLLTAVRRQLLAPGA